MKKKTLSLAVLGTMLALGSASQAQAASAVLFDQDGAGAGTPFLVDAFDWLPSSALAVNVITPDVGKKFNLFAHSKLGQMTYNNDLIAESKLNSAYEVTFVLGFGEIVTGNDPLKGTADFALNPAGTPGHVVNFFQMYIDTAKNADRSLTTGPAGAGTLHNDGTLIYAGKVTYANDGYQMDNPTAVPLDQSANGNQWPGVSTVTGSGSGQQSYTALVATDYINPDYFPEYDPLSPIAIGLEVNFNTNYNTPFREVDPATMFWDPTLGGGAGGYISPSVGFVNGLFPPYGGPDFIFQIDANQSFQPVPEPATMVLFGTGLVSLAGLGRRRTRKEGNA